MELRGPGKGKDNVKRTLTRVKNRSGGPLKTELIFKEPKRGKFRTVPLAGFVVEAVKAHKAKQNEERLFCGQNYRNNGLVFCTEDGKPLDPRNMVNRFKKLLQQAGLDDTTFHNWRHTCASILLEMGVHPKVVQEILGHSRIATTLDTYSHLVPGMLEAAAAKLDEAFAETKKPSAKGGSL